MLSTTHPSSSTDVGHTSGGGPWCISWVFPSALGMPIVDGHVVGRDDGCGTVLDGTEISRRHAEFRVQGRALTIHDLGSRNGVMVNGVRRKEGSLAFGDVVRCGEWIGIVGSQERSGFGEIAPGWHGGAALAAAAEPARRVPADLPIIIQGETGTGKEGMARAIHGWNGRRGAFVAVNCAALPAHLAEAELFGYRKGAFTGADKASPGLFRAAHGGTLFLDEILDLPEAIQPKLLRVLEQREVLPLGETAAVAIDARIVAASQESLVKAALAGRFRPDLLARLDGLTIVLPPLRERREDVVPLLLHFLRDYAGGPAPALQAKLAEALCLYDWPLNVRELLLLARRLLAVHGPDGILKRSFLPARMLEGRPAASRASSGPPGRRKRAWRKTDDQAEFETLIEALRSARGSANGAAQALGISRARAYRLLSAHPDFCVKDAKK